MRRSLWILVGVALTGALLAAGVYRLSARVCASCLASPTDDLAWLRLEFKLSTAEVQRIRDLHAGYRPQCEHYCAQIAAMKRRLAADLASGAPVTPPADEQLAAIAAVRATCQAAMLAHFETVSRELPADQGRRYLAVMREITLGRHAEVEASMASPCCNPEHGTEH